MRAILLAAALLATPVHAKQWADDACFVVVTSEGDRFHVYFDDGRPETDCTVKDWPVSSAAATLSCDNGWQPKMQLDDGGTAMILDEYKLRTPTDENGVCD